MLNHTIFHHPQLGALKGEVINERLLQFRDLPYGCIPQRFARSTVVENLPGQGQGQPYDATGVPPGSVQPKDAAKTDCKGNQLPIDLVEGYQEDQSEDCSTLNITMPTNATSSSSLPVIVFLHGGAFFLGSSTRPYYSPIKFCEQSLERGLPHVFVSMNYRLGGLGFFHSPEAEQVIPANNGVHDQLVGFEFVRKFVRGFGGDPTQITAMGQSAGAMSLSIHSLSGIDNAWKRSIQFSGSLVTMPVQSPKEHQQNFLSQAAKLGIDTKGRSSREIAKDMLAVPVNDIRDTGYVGMPCSQSELLPYETASMALTRRRPPTSQSQIVASATYDGGISYNMMLQDSKRKDHAKVFINIAEDVLEHPQGLLDLYGIEAENEDTVALRKICQFESDVGFFAASLAQAQGCPGKTYLLLFDLGNPFEGSLPAKQYATHTWDIVALLGAYEDRLDEEYKGVVASFREKLLLYATTGEAPWPAWTEVKGEALVMDRQGLRVVVKDDYMAEESRRGKLLALAEKEAGENGCDVLWSDVCRRFLMQGE
ncbi:hypothetical protein B0A55_05464 [Friedmanniomyces simplex]|uniref:Carboxylesterase type B domain-containing protein n=1 Tax=Friedmanniomyces simplex TaxID=329884 RepID=A0A4U0X6C4_9PEZI|nr:hypothetical protein B0A55_05464 [Friedmanniomyces simplex]